MKDSPCRTLIMYVDYPEEIFYDLDLIHHSQVGVNPLLGNLICDQEYGEYTPEQ